MVPNNSLNFEYMITITPDPIYYNYMFRDVKEIIGYEYNLTKLPSAVELLKRFENEELCVLTGHRAQIDFRYHSEVHYYANKIENNHVKFYKNSHNIEGMITFDESEIIRLFNYTEEKWNSLCINSRNCGWGGRVISMESGIIEGLILDVKPIGHDNSKVFLTANEEKQKEAKEKAYKEYLRAKRNEEFLKRTVEHPNECEEFRKDSTDFYKYML